MTTVVWSLLSRSNLERLGAVIERGAHDAARGLSEMVGATVSVDSSELILLDLEKVVGIAGGPEEYVTAMYLGIAGEVSGHLIELFSAPMALRLVDLLLGEPEGCTAEMDEMANSALGELANITGSAFLNAVGNVTGLTLLPTPPVVLSDMCGAILDPVVAEIAQRADEALVVQIRLTRDGGSGGEVDGQLLVLPSLDSLRLIVDRLPKED